MYYGGKTIQSTELYREALKINPNNQKAHFNLGNSLYKNALEIKASKQNLIQGGKKITTDSLANLVFDEAAGSFAQVANSISNKDTLHQAWHNIGNCYLQKKDYQQAFDAYKKSMKYDPKDEETRYNMAYALKNIPKDKISQITLCLGDESQIPFSKSFDAVCSFFFIDLFPSPKAETITQRLTNCLKSSGILLYADFEAEGKNRKWRKHLIRLMYLVCGLFCKLENKFYWNYTSVLTKNHFCLKDSKVFFYGLVRASLYVIER
jgi:tetratricopeptide (TPR) repeat protein